MEIQMSFKHMLPSEAVKTHTRDRSEKLKKYFDGKISLNWNFLVDHSGHVAHCHLIGNHMDFFAEAATEHMTSSIDQAINKLETQIR